MKGRQAELRINNPFSGDFLGSSIPLSLNIKASSFQTTLTLHLYPLLNDDHDYSTFISPVAVQRINGRKPWICFSRLLR